MQVGFINPLTTVILHSTEATYCTGDGSHIEVIHWHLVAFFSFVVGVVQKSDCRVNCCVDDLSLVELCTYIHKEDTLEAKQCWCKNLASFLGSFNLWCMGGKCPVTLGSL